MITRALLAAAVATLALAAPATAAQLTNSGGTLTFTGTDALNRVEITQPGADQVRVRRVAPLDSDPITASGCTENTAGGDYTCNGVTSVIADGHGGDDALDANGLTSLSAILTGGAGDDGLVGGAAGDNILGFEGDDSVDANGGNDTADGGPGLDVVVGDAGVDTVEGGAGMDNLDGGDDNDTLRGGSGGDRVISGGGDDVLEGGEGEDVMSGENGNDQQRGGDGNDLLIGDPGNDDLTGGDGFDTAVAPPPPPPPAAPPTLFANLDDAPNDRLSGEPAEADNVHGDVEAVVAEFQAFTIVPPSGDDTFIGNASANDLAGYSGNDTLEGGAGNDVLRGGDGNDTIRARDGYADFVACGAGADTVEADTLDRLEECETRNVQEVGSAIEDRPPTVELTGPAPNALLRTTAPTTMTANATDDRGVAQVLFLDDDRIVCTDPVAPYTCDYRPRGEDVGRNTLVAVAVDTAQQTASTTRTFRVDRFTARITGTVTPARDRRAPFRFVSSGRLRLPTGVTSAVGCAAGGIVSVQVKAGGRTISNRRVGLRRDCQFGSAVTFSSRARFGRSSTLRFTIRFNGNEVLKRSTAVARNIRTR